MTISEFTKKIEEEREKSVATLSEKYKVDFQLFGLSNVRPSNEIKQDSFKKCSVLQEGFLYTPASLSK